jgi:prophage regulatory protein
MAPSELNVVHDEPRLVSWSELRRIIPLSRTTVWRRIRDGRFPQPLKISPGRVAWLKAEIVAWIEDQRRTL